MAKNHSFKFWIIFWTVSALLLAGFYLFLSLGSTGIKNATNILPVGEKYKSVIHFADYLAKKDNREKTFLLLFQNNMEIRPGGGFIGAFGILKIKNGQITETQIHDTGNFDARVPATVPAPYPVPEILRVKYLQLRDSNWSPDFPTNARAAEEFYYAGKGEEKFDGIVGITTNVLTSFLKVIGPMEITGYPGTYGDENAVLALEYQVEKSFDEQGIPRGERKSVMNNLAKAILAKTSQLDAAKKLELAKIIFENLNRKDIQLYFKDAFLQGKAKEAGWDGTIDQNWSRDYLMAVDANLGAFKSDYRVKRSADYMVDLTGEVPKAVLKITYNHTAAQKDFMTKDYLSYLRVYVPENSWLVSSKNFDGTKFGVDLNKKFFGAIVTVPIGTSKTVILEYTLPKDIAWDYNLKIQKQSGINGEPVAVHIINPNGETKDYNVTLDSDVILNK